MSIFSAELAAQVNHKIHGATHLVYLTLVFIESHGMYGYAAGGMAIITIIGVGIDKRIKEKKEKKNV